jgi:hypothetical protein
MKLKPVKYDVYTKVHRAVYSNTILSVRHNIILYCYGKINTTPKLHQLHELFMTSEGNVNYDITNRMDAATNRKT